GQLEPIKTHVVNAAMNQYQLFQTSLQNQFDDKEQERSLRLDNAEKEIRSLKDRQFYTALGGVAVSLGLGILGVYGMRK
ncbi:hypothetical protein ACI3PL_27685, partial [Lacticaseibacillus paracasei]